jgi:hypothetical protein
VWRLANWFQRGNSRTHNFDGRSGRNGYYQYNRHNGFNELNGRRSNGVSIQSIGNPKTVDATSHPKAQAIMSYQFGRPWTLLEDLFKLQSTTLS